MSRIPKEIETDSLLLILLINLENRRDNFLTRFSKLSKKKVLMREN